LAESQNGGNQTYEARDFTASDTARPSIPVDALEMDQAGYIENGVASVIVEYHKSPVARQIARLKEHGQKGKVLENSLQQLEAELEQLHRRFESDLFSIQDKSKAASSVSGSPQLLHTYSHIYAGAAVSLPGELIPRVRELSYVKEIYPDQRMEVVSDTVRKIIGAGRLGNDTSTTGRDIDIAILDTGIDYMHPALGGGMGENYKVKGGYDEVNRDSDPMDDNGHGTQVAGVIAADGEVKGVAPEANLYAYKVMNEEGTGNSSNIMEGLERTVKQGVDIVNMSLGGPGHSEDPLSKAVNNAVRSGVLVVVAAGNDGEDYWTMKSPASSELALTVGATYKNNQITRFSSRGPTPEKFNIKPDIVAPGSDIYTTTLSGKYGSYNGTSMSAPVVSGAAALLLEVKTGTPPLIAKSKLVQSAKDIGENIWTQGGGLVQVDRALTQTTVSVPAHVSFGLVPNEPSEWTSRDTVTYYNLSAHHRTYDITVDGDHFNGVDVSTNVSNLNIAAGDSAQVIVTAYVNNRVADYPTDQPLDYSGTVQAVSSNDTLGVHWGFIKVPHLTVTTRYYGVIDLYAHPTNTVGKHKSVRTISTGQEESVHWRFLENEPYNIVAEYWHNRQKDYRIVVREGVDIATLDTLRLQPDEVDHTITLEPVDENGAKLSDYDRISSIKKLSHETGFSLKRNAGTNSIKVSALSDRYKIEGYNQYRVRKEDFVYHDYTTNFFRFEGLQEDKVVTDNPDNYRSLTYTLSEGEGHSFINDLGAVVGSYTPPYKEELNEIQVFRNDVQKKYVLHLLPQDLNTRYITYDQAYNKTIFQSARHRITDQDSIVFKRSKYEYKWHVDDFQEIKVGHVIPFFSAGINNEMIWTGEDRGFFHDMFGGLLAKPGPITDDLIIKLHRSGTVIQEEEIPRSPFEDLAVDLKNPGQGDWLEITFAENKYRVDDTLSTLTARYYYGSGNSGTAPKISNLRLTSGGKPTNKLSFRNLNAVELRLNEHYEAVSARMGNYNAVDSIQVYYRTTGSGQQWNMLDKNKNQTSIKARISDLQTGYYDLQTTIFDNRGNRLEYEASPAFKYISPYRRFNVTSTVQAQEARFRVAVEAVDSLGYDDIHSYDFKVSYDDSLLSFKRVWRDATISHNASVDVEQMSPGRLRISVNSPEPIRGRGDLLQLQFQSKTKQGISPVTISDFNLSSRDLITYVSEGSVKVLPAMLGDLSKNGEITAYDAYKILEYTHDLTDLSSDEKTVANVGGSEWVTAHDALLVLQMVVGHIDEFPIRDLNERNKSVVRANGPEVISENEEGMVYIGKPSREESGAFHKIQFPLMLKSTDKVRAVSANLQFQADQLEMGDMNFSVNGKWVTQYRFDPYNQKLNLAVAGSNALTDKKIAVVEVRVDKDLHDNIDLSVKGTSRINEEAAAAIAQQSLLNIPDRIQLKPNYPNPFNPATTIEYGLPDETEVRLAIYDVQGREIQELVNQTQRAGMHQVTFNGSDLSSGVYFYSLQTPQGTLTKKLLLVK